MAVVMTSNVDLRAGDNVTPWSAAVMGTDVIAGQKSIELAVQQKSVPGYLLITYSFDAAPTAISLNIEQNEGGGIWTLFKNTTNVNGDTIILPAYHGKLRFVYVSGTGTSQLTLSVKHVQELPNNEYAPAADATYNLGRADRRWLGVISSLFDVCSPKLGRMKLVVNEEEITLATGAATSDSVANLLPANSIILAVMGRITQTITTAVNWKIGDANVADRFRLSNSTMTLNEAQVGLETWSVRLTEGTPNTITSNTGPLQTAAAKVRITLNANPGAGKVRVTVFALSFTVAQS